jgi:short-subunit dehydrogenase
MSTPSPRHIALVGATSSIAEHCARRWLAAGGVQRLTLIGRNPERLDALAADLRIRGGNAEVRCLAGDLTTPPEVERLVTQACQPDAPDLVLIAHGSLAEQADCQNDLALAFDTLLVNGASPALFAEAFVRRLIAAGQPATLGLIGSVAGDRGRKTNYVYGAAKGLVERYAQGLQHRLAATAVRVCLVKPGPTATPMTAHLQAQGAKLAPVEQVAADIVRGLAAGKAVIYTPAKWRLIMAVIRHLPRGVFHKLNI